MTTDYLPALISPRLLPRYDGLARLSGAGAVYWRLVAQAGIQPGSSVLEIGCGTGNVVLRAKRAVPSATVTGIDPDPEALRIARGKAGRENLDLRLDRGTAEDLPYDDGSADRVLSSLMLHHVAADAQVTALREARRVLAPGGSLHLVDLDHDPRVAGPLTPLNRALSLLHRLDQLAHRAPRPRSLMELRPRETRPKLHEYDGAGHGHGHGHGHGAGRAVPELLDEAGFREVTVVGGGRTGLGALTFYRAER
ncbi:class I SAM-dependent methyltransferase [Pseudonocardia sp. HH130630-07]|uniref:class I SAM-dependent methyltransferase n=1 Tax=Pseudonocardia sp. HH130630-07 TaxID=1690815 RepID=UPI000814F773|nr:class I SAM-dependent methyltransferase [Pseudonocardia sp. HH130630-07]ANY06597.1 hypothetical protein AFB00_10175 [Pseudonocardia sp. HH130630-07]